MSPLARLATVAAALAGCQAPAGGALAPIIVEPLREYRTCPHGTKVGDFRIELLDNATAVSGYIPAGVVPVDVREVVESSGGCRLLRRRQLLCDPPCGTMTCGEGGRCVPYPENLDAGTVTVAGLLGPVTMRPDPRSHRYWQTELPHPGFRPGADIGLVASGAELPPFSLAGWGVAALAADGELPPLEPARPLPLLWRAGPPGPARLELTIAVDQHGVTPATLLCEVEDVGHFEVPAGVLGSLLAAGVSGYPSLALSRQTVDRVMLPPGCVELVVASAVVRALGVNGHAPCRADADCPATRRCNVASQTCL